MCGVCVLIALLHCSIPLQDMGFVMRKASECSNLSGTVTTCVFRPKSEVLVPVARKKGGEEV